MYVHFHLTRCLRVSSHNKWYPLSAKTWKKYQTNEWWYLLKPNPPRAKNLRVVNFLTAKLWQGHEQDHVLILLEASYPAPRSISYHITCRHPSYILVHEIQGDEKVKLMPLLQLYSIVWHNYNGILRWCYTMMQMKRGLGTKNLQHIHGKMKYLSCNIWSNVLPIVYYWVFIIIVLPQQKENQLKEKWRKVTGPAALNMIESPSSNKTCKVSTKTFWSFHLIYHVSLSPHSSPLRV